MLLIRRLKSLPSVVGKESNWALRSGTNSKRDQPTEYTTTRTTEERAMLVLALDVPRGSEGFKNRYEDEGMKTCK